MSGSTPTTSKGVLEEFLEQLGLRGVAYVRHPNTPVFLESAAIALGGKVPLGQLGQLLPGHGQAIRPPRSRPARRTGPQPTPGPPHPSKAFKPLPAFPSIRRDVALIVGESVTHDTVLEAIRAAKPQSWIASISSMSSAEAGVPPGTKASPTPSPTAIRNAPSPTPKVNATHDRVVAHLLEIDQRRRVQRPATNSPNRASSWMSSGKARSRKTTAISRSWWSKTSPAAASRASSSPRSIPRRSSPGRERQSVPASRS
jgi:hypothetical protein